MAHLTARFLDTLSGWQGQRGALLCALVAPARLALYDEPMSNLNGALRESLALEIRGLMRELGLSVLYVTKYQATAFQIAYRMAVMLNGAIAQVDWPEVIFAATVRPEVSRLLNIGTTIAGRINDGRFRSHCGGLNLPG